MGIGTMHYMKSVFLDIFIPVWTCRAYTIKEKINIWIAKLFFLPGTNLYSEILTTDFITDFPVLEVPVFFFSGEYDFTVNADLSKIYFEYLKAPRKEFYSFEHSAHSPLFEEPGKFRHILKQNILVNEMSSHCGNNYNIRQKPDVTGLSSNR